MNINITKQNKHSKRITIWDYDWNYFPDDPAKAVRSLYQFAEGYEPIDWIAENITAEQFNELYSSGQRMFWLKSAHEFITVVMGYPNPTRTFDDLNYEVGKLDDLICYCQNSIEGYLNEKEFTGIVNSFVEFQKDRDKLKLERSILAIEKANESRLYDERKL